MIDVILPAYNGASFIWTALDSALAQDVPLRILVVDDGSTDDSAAIARSYGSRVAVVTQQNQGVSGARNTALSLATAPYVAFLDQDDVWRPDKLRRQLQQIEQHPEVGLVFCDMSIVRSDGMVVEDGFLQVTPEYSALKRTPLGDGAFLLADAVGSAIVRYNFISPSTVLARRQALLDIGGFDTQFRLCDDAECWMRLLRRWRAIAIEDTLVVSLLSNENASLVKWKGVIQERIGIGRKASEQPDLFPPDAADYLRRERPVAHYRLGVGAMRAGNIAEARSWLSASLAEEWRITTALAFVATLLPSFVREPLLRLKRATGLRWSIRV